MTAKILLTGPPACGKTTVARRVAEILEGRAVGFFTAEVRGPGGERVGFSVESIDGRRGELSGKRQGQGPRVGGYLVDVASFEKVALPALAARPGAVFVIDEIGKMECLSEPFRRRVCEILDSGAPLLATIPLRGGGPFIAGIRERGDVEVILVTRENRDLLPAELAARF